MLSKLDHLLRCISRFFFNWLKCSKNIFPICITYLRTFFECQKCLDSDADDLENFKKHDDKITRSLIMEKVVHFVEDSQSIKDVDCLVSPGKKHAPKSADARKSYCLSIYLNKIKFFNSRPEIKNIEFR